MSLREVSAWARMRGIAEVSDVALLNRLRHAADWFWSLAGQVLSICAGAEDIGERPLRLVDGTVLTAPGGQGADWRLHMGYEPRGCRFTDVELADGKGAERLDRFVAGADEVRIAGAGSRPDSIRVFAEGPGDYLVRVHWHGLHWLDANGDRFDVMAFLRGFGTTGSGEPPILIGRGKDRTGQAPFAARLVALRLPDDKVQAARHRIAAESRRKGRLVQPETLEAAAHVLLPTSLDPEDYPAARPGALYRLRWQVELAFRRLKRLPNLDALRAREPDLARARIYTNLLAAFLIDDMIRPAPDSPP